MASRAAGARWGRPFPGFFPIPLSWSSHWNRPHSRERCAFSRGWKAPPPSAESGSTSLIVSCLEKKLIEAIAAQNDFAAGYLAIDAAVAAAEGRPLSPAEPIGFSIVRQDTMYLPENQKLLFPFVR